MVRSSTVARGYQQPSLRLCDVWVRTQFSAGVAASMRARALHNGSIAMVALQSNIQLRHAALVFSVQLSSPLNLLTVAYGTYCYGIS